VRVKQIFEHYPRQDPSTGEFKLCPFCGGPLLMVESGHKLRATCSSCGFVPYCNPAPTVSVSVVDGERVLLGKRGGHPGKGVWSLPSGYIEYEDDFLNTAIREAKEETGLDIEVTSVINVVCFFVDRRFRGQGLTLGLLQAALDYAASQGAQIVEGYPVEPGSRLCTYMGSPATFRQAGFRDVTPAGQARLVMRYAIS
jgi:ADP-ribose pyrophosphatase YjhB (NUDIX family)